MSINQILLGIIIFFMVTCKGDQKANYMSEIEQLTDYVKQSEYLEKISVLDQSIREKRGDLLQKSGPNCKEYLDSRDTMIKIDNINLIKIEAYLEKYGYPTLKTHSKIATMTPWLIIHHNPSKEIFKKHFKTLYKAYKIGDLDGGFFTLYLGRFYGTIYGKSLDLINPYTEEFEVDTLVKALNLEPMRAEINAELKPQ